MEGWILLGKIKKVPSIWIRGRFLLFYTLFFYFPGLVSGAKYP